MTWCSLAVRRRATDGNHEEWRWPKPWLVAASDRNHPKPAVLVKSLVLGALAASLVAVFGERHDVHAKTAVMVPPVPERTQATPPQPVAPPAQADTVVMVVIDGIRWQEIFGGVDQRLARRHGIKPENVVAAADLTPNLYRLRTEWGAALGAPGVGAPISATGPVYRSLPGYMELLSGTSAAYCKSNRCGKVRYRTLIDDVVTASDDPQAGALFASWPHLVHAAALGKERGVVSAGRKGGWHHAQIYDTPARQQLRARARVAGPSPSKGDFRADAYTAGLALNYLTDKQPRFLFISMGEADAFGHSNNYGAYLGALRRSDEVIGKVMDITQRLNLAGHRTTLLVTTDHGRDRNAREHGPGITESARVWLVAGGYGVHRRGNVPSPGARALSDIAPAVRHLLALPGAKPALPELFSD